MRIKHESPFLDQEALEFLREAEEDQETHHPAEELLEDVGRYSLHDLRLNSDDRGSDTRDGLGYGGAAGCRHRVRRGRKLYPLRGGR